MILNPNAILERVDIWSFGMVFFKLLYGDTPQFDLDKKPLFPLTTSNVSTKT